MSHEKDDEFTRRRRAEEQALIETIRYKRKRIKLAPSFPSEDEIQHKIRTILSSVIDLIQSDNLFDFFTEIRGRKPHSLPKTKPLFYKCHLEKVHLQACHITDKIRCGTEALSMGYDLYRLLVQADDSLASSRDKFFEEEIKGVSFDPTFTAEFVRKELEFLEDFCQKIQTEIREAELQLNNETHESCPKKSSAFLANLEQKIDEKFEHFSQQQEQFGRRITDLESKLDKTREHCSQLQEEIKCMLKEPKESTNVVSEKHSQSPVVTPSRPSIEEDLLDLEDDIVFQNSDEGDVDDNNNASEKPTVEEERLELEHRLNVLRNLVHMERKVPERKISMRDVMQEKDRFLRCSFCFAKGFHYSDSCPEVPTVKGRLKRIRCEHCLDIRHETVNCWKLKKECMYCSSTDHNKAICTLPERIYEYYREIEEIERELEENKEYYYKPGGGPPRKGEYHDGDH
ncbi:hypothetical protein OSTOST_10515 [Ostertagia ostertagi]